MVDALVLEKSDRSEIWNSYTRVPDWFEEAFCTMKVGRKVDNCSSFAGVSTVGVPRVGAGGADGVVGVLELHPASRTTAARDRLRNNGVGEMDTLDYLGEK
jgi:hypothetical protein